ncbi:FAD-dependent thymidylate synthase, partial [Acidithiobacillus thiooxidans]
SGELAPKEGGRDPYRGRARELLRNVMPVAAYSDVYWTINFRSLMNFFNLRRKGGAQYEIREYADAAFTLFEQRFPLLAETMQRVLEESQVTRS